MSLVIDSSIAVAWLLPDEQATEADRAIAEVMSGGADVPAHFFAEVANLLAVSERHRRISSALMLLADLSVLDFRRDGAGSFEPVAQAVVLASRHGLTVYDAMYLELARRLGAPLATLDNPLRRAAVEAGVRLVS